MDPSGAHRHAKEAHHERSSVRPSETVNLNSKRGYGDRAKTLHAAYRVSDLAASLAFYAALGYVEVGRSTSAAAGR
jgi:hypothetical protein